MSKLIEWSDSYATGITEVDSQHQKLFRIIQELQVTAANPNVSKEVLTEIFIRLGEYVTMHFFLEEQMMEEAGYKQLAAHKKEHEAFEEKVQEIRSQLESVQSVEEVRSQAKQLVEFLVDWLSSHIMKTDQAYVGFVA